MSQWKTVRKDIQIMHIIGEPVKYQIQAGVIGWVLFTNLSVCDESAGRITYWQVCEKDESNNQSLYLVRDRFYFYPTLNFMLKQGILIFRNSPINKINFSTFGVVIHKHSSKWLPQLSQRNEEKKKCVLVVWFSYLLNSSPIIKPW